MAVVKHELKTDFKGTVDNISNFIDDVKSKQIDSPS